MQPAPKQEIEQERGRAGILVITADDRFYYSLLSVAIDIGWTIQRSRTVEGAWQGFRPQAVPIVVYDERLPGADWRDDLRALSLCPARPVVLLAVCEVDEERWRMVLRCQGYDAIGRSASGDEWIRMLRFAWDSKDREPVLPARR